MRTLLLLLMACLLPLQLFAATLNGVPSASEQGTEQHRHRSILNPELISPSALHALAFSVPMQCSSEMEQVSAIAPEQNLVGGGHLDDGEERDSSSSQAELEDQTLPAQLATLQVPWLPFPHIFPTPLLSTSFVRDQLRPPPLG